MFKEFCFIDRVKNLITDMMIDTPSADIQCIHIGHI